jgi:hypothetical protein
MEGKSTEFNHKGHEGTLSISNRDTQPTGFGFIGDGD